MKLNREQAIKIINLLDEVKAEVTQFLDGSITVEVKEETKQEATFKVGDEVKVINNDFTSFKIGDIGNVIKYERIDRLYEVLNKNKKTQWFREEQLQLVEKKTVNQQRAEIIEKAKLFIKEHANHHYMSEEPNNKVAKQCWYETEFITKNNSITTLIFPSASVNKRLLKEPLFVGRSICKDGDVFNKHIGEAIALGRALNLDVSGFENAVQPTVAVGQITKILDPSGKETNEICKVVSLNEYAYPVYIDGMHASYYKIINDTNAIYNDSKEGK